MSDSELKKTIGYKTILLITLNAVMGTGIFFLPALGARDAGPASIIAWALIAVFSIGMAAVFGELTSMFPTAGGVYEFCKQAYNGFWAFLVGWITFLTSNVTIAMLIVGAIEYLAPIQAPVQKILIALLFVLIFHGIAYFGMRTSSTMLVAFAFITLATLLSIIVPGALQFDPSNLTPFFVFPLPFILIAAVSVMETFFGWETATFLAGETKNGEIAVPRALITATIITSIISLIVAIVGMGVIPWEIFGNSSAPLNLLSEAIHGGNVSFFFGIAVYLSLIGSVAGWIVAAPRLMLSMASDKLFISQLAAIHPKHNSPYKAIIFQGVFVSLLILVSSAAYETVLHLLLPLACLQYVAVLLALVFLRIKQKETHRPFRFTFGIPGALILMSALIGLMTYWLIAVDDALKSLQLASSVILAGIPIFFLLKVYYDPDATMKLNDTFAYLAYFTEKIALPKAVQKEIMFLMGELKGKSVLEYGCSIGTLTVQLAHKVSNAGKVYATNISRRELSISQKRTQQAGHQHVVFIHDEHQANRVHPYIPKVDAVVSFGMLTYMQDVKKILNEMNKITHTNGKIIFVDWVNFFHILPDVEWLTKDQNIIDVFRSCGFAVTITRKKGWFWDYLYIHGYKTSKGPTSVVYI